MTLGVKMDSTGVRWLHRSSPSWLTMPGSEQISSTGCYARAGILDPFLDVR